MRCHHSVFVIWMVLTGSSQATASVDYATDELIGKTIRQSVIFSILHSTILTGTIVSSLKVRS